MKNRKIVWALLPIFVFGMVGCAGNDKEITLTAPAAQVVEFGTSVRFAPLSDKATNVSKYQITVKAPNGEEKICTEKSFLPETVGDYVIKYEAFNGESIVATKSTLLTVLTAEAPVITVKQNVENVIWTSGGSYTLPDVMVTDNLDINLPYEVSVKDSDGKALNMSGGKITVQKSGTHTITYTAKDNGGNKGEKTVEIYATAENEIAAFETEKLVSRFSSVADCAISYNTDKKYTYANSSGSLKASFTKAASGTYPRVVLLGDKMPYPNLFETDYDGLRFKVYLTGNVDDLKKQDIYVFFATQEKRKQVKLNACDDFGMNGWFEFSVDKETLKTTFEFGETALTEMYIWTVLKGENERLDLYIDNVEYYKN